MRESIPWGDNPVLTVVIVILQGGKIGQSLAYDVLRREWEERRNTR